MSRLLLPAIFALGCATAPSVSSERIVQLPPESRTQIIQSQQSVDVAAQNVTAAKVALDEAQRFREIADRELDGAKAHTDAARAGLELGRRAHSNQTMLDSRGRYDLAVRELFSARAKKDYSDRLIDLRRAELDQRQNELNLARADFEWNKFVQLHNAGQADDLRQVDFERARARAQNDVATSRIRVADLQGRVEQLRTNWMARSQEYQTASRGNEIMPPPPRRPIDYPPPEPRIINPPPAGGANEGPSAPQSIPID